MARVDAFQEYEALQQIRAIVPVPDDVLIQVYRRHNYSVEHTIAALLDTEDVPLNEHNEVLL